MSQCRCPALADVDSVKASKVNMQGILFVDLACRSDLHSQCIVIVSGASGEREHSTDHESGFDITRTQRYIETDIPVQYHRQSCEFSCEAPWGESLSESREETPQSETHGTHCQRLSKQFD